MFLIWNIKNLIIIPKSKTILNILFFRSSCSMGSICCYIRNILFLGNISFFLTVFRIRDIWYEYVIHRSVWIHFVMVQLHHPALALFVMVASRCCNKNKLFWSFFLLDEGTFSSFLIDNKSLINLSWLLFVFRNFLFLGFQPLSPGHEFYPSNPNVVCFLYTI